MLFIHPCALFFIFCLVCRQTGSTVFLHANSSKPQTTCNVSALRMALITDRQVGRRERSFGFLKIHGEAECEVTGIGSPGFFFYTIFYCFLVDFFFPEKAENVEAFHSLKPCFNCKCKSDRNCVLHGPRKPVLKGFNLKTSSLIDSASGFGFVLMVQPGGTTTTWLFQTSSNPMKVWCLGCIPLRSAGEVVPPAPCLLPDRDGAEGDGCVHLHFCCSPRAAG